MNHQPLDCIELVELVTDYLENRLPAADRRRFEAHLGDCEGCVANIAQMRETVQLLNDTPAESLTPEASESILALFRDWNDPKRPDDTNSTDAHPEAEQGIGGAS